MLLMVIVADYWPCWLPNGNWDPTTSGMLWASHSHGDPLVQVFIEKTHNKKNPCTNLSYRKSLALKELSNDLDLIIREADKGGVIAIMNKWKYKEKVMRQLGDSSSCISYVKSVQRIIDLLNEGLSKGHIAKSSTDILI